MNIDIRTLAIFLNITCVLQVLALLTQYRLNQHQPGLGWWTFGGALWACGFAFNSLRDNPILGETAIVANNLLFVSCLAIIHIGTLRFFGQREHKKPLIAFLLLFSLITIYFTFINNNLLPRRLNFSLAVAFLCFLISWNFYSNKSRSNSNVIIGIALAFGINGLFFSIRALTPFWGTVGNLFTASTLQIASYLSALILSSLWTFAFIILLNQRLNEENKNNKENLQIIFNTSPDIVLISRLRDGLLVEINAEFSRQIGFTRAEVIGKTTLEINFWKEALDHQKFVAEVTEKGFCKSLETIFVRKDGTEFAGIISAKKLDLQGVAHILSNVREITAEKQAQEALKRSEAHYHLISDNTADLIWTVDMQTQRYTFVSPSVTKVRGYTQQEALSQSMADVLTPESYKKLMQQVFEQPPALGLGSALIELDQICKDGSIIHTEVTSNYALDDNGQFQVVGLTRDVTTRNKIETALRESEEKYRVLFRDSPDALLIITDGIFVDCNRASEVMLQCERSEIIGQTPAALSPKLQPDGSPSVSAAEEKINLAFQTGTSTFEWVHKRLNGSDFFVEVSISAIELDGKPSLFTAWRDISDRKRAENTLRENEQRYRLLAESNTAVVWDLRREISNRERTQAELAESEHRYRLLAENISDVIWVINSTDLVIRYISPSVQHLLGYSAEEMTGLVFDESLISENYPQFQQSLKEKVEGFLANPDFSKGERIELVFLRVDGSSVYTETVMHCYFNSTTGEVEIQGDSRDITERKYLEEELNRQATTDELTKIFNRRYFMSEAQDEQKSAARHRQPYAIAVIDLDHFKTINDTYGHAVGDLALLTFTEICTKCIREVDIFARLGGDEFALLLPQTTRAQATQVIERIHQSVTEKSIDLGGNRVKITLTTGLACSTDGHETLEALMIRADQALYRAKEAGRNQIGYDIDQ